MGAVRPSYTRYAMYGSALILAGSVVAIVYGMFPFNQPLNQCIFVHPDRITSTWRHAVDQAACRILKKNCSASHLLKNVQSLYPFVEGVQLQRQGSRAATITLSYQTFCAQLTDALGNCYLVSEKGLLVPQSCLIVGQQPLPALSFARPAPSLTQREMHELQSFITALPPAWRGCAYTWKSPREIIVDNLPIQLEGCTLALSCNATTRFDGLLEKTLAESARRQTAAAKGRGKHLHADVRWNTGTHRQIIYRPFS